MPTTVSYFALVANQGTSMTTKPDKLTDEQLAAMDETLEHLFAHVLAQLPALTESIPAIVNDAIDVRTVLSAIAQSSPHNDADQMLAVASSEYEKLIDNLRLCRDRVRVLMDMGHEILDYSTSITNLLSPEQVTAEEKARIVEAAALLAGLKMGRNLTWSAGVLNFSEAVRGLDKAQGVLLNKTTRAGSVTAVIKAGLGDVIGGVIPGFSALVAIGKAATPPVDKQIDALSAALGTLKAIFLFREIAESQNVRCELAISILDDAVASEAKALSEMQEILGPLRKPK